MRVCARPGCPELADERYSYCSEHERERKRTYDERRGSRHQRGYGSRWEKARKAFLRANKWCRLCEAEGKRVPATEVDHIEPHKGDKRKFWNRKNWQPLCKPHHSAKTMAELHGRKYQPKGCSETGEPLDGNSPWYTDGGKGSAS